MLREDLNTRRATIKDKADRSSICTQSYREPLTSVGASAVSSNLDQSHVGMKCVGKGG